MRYRLLAHPRFLSLSCVDLRVSPFAAFLCLLLCCCFHCLLSLRLRRLVLYLIAQLPSSRVLPSLLGSWCSSLHSSCLLWLQFSLSPGRLSSLLCPGSPGLWTSVPRTGLVFLLLALGLALTCLYPSAEHWVPIIAYSPVLVTVEPASLLRCWLGSCSRALLGGVSLSCCNSHTVPSPPFAAPSLRSFWLCLFLHGSGVPFCVGVSSFVCSSSILGVFVPLAFSTLALWLVLVSSDAVRSLFLFVSLCIGFLLLVPPSTSLFLVLSSTATFWLVEVPFS